MSIAALFTDAVGLLTKRPPTKPVPAGPDVAAAPPDTRRLIRNRQYCHVLSKQAKVDFDEVSIHCARSVLEYEMALVPGGNVCLRCDTVESTPYGPELISNLSEPITVDPFYMDRVCVTNADYAKFVNAGGYTNPHFWPEGVLANVLQFVDRTGQPGPKFWSDGQPPRDKSDHPVVGISWYEASAYAAWVGKRLPTSEQWQRSGTWPKSGGSHGSDLRYPWGNAFDPFKANTWACGTGRTFPVDAFFDGNTPNGIRQLIGNVWEWVDAQFHPMVQEGASVLLEDSMAEVRGGAFDTYFHSHATCQFRTGQPLLYRGANVGFRCCIGETSVAHMDLPETNQRSIDGLQWSDPSPIPFDHERIDTNQPTDQSATDQSATAEASKIESNKIEPSLIEPSNTELGER